MTEVTYSKNLGNRQEHQSGKQPFTAESVAKERTIRVFVSSTFRDMYSEREELVKFTFPELRKRCREREIELTEVDLRWGVTDEQAAEGKALPICLAEIERCKPYFIGFLGERYGYVPEEIDEELLTHQPWLREHREKSITELEILHGVLKNPEMKKLSFFYFRDPESTRQLEAQLTQRNDYQPEPESSLAKLKSLKDKIRSYQNIYPVPVREDYPDAKTLGKMVLEDLWKVIDERFPREEVPTALEKERLEHEAFAAARRKVYIGREEYFYKLDEHAAGDGPPLVILGESGSGKSALIANWTEKYQKKHPDHFMVSYYVGSTVESTDHLHMLYHIIKEIKQHYEPANSKFEQRLTEEEEHFTPDPKKIIEDFHLMLVRAANKGKIILIFDGLSRLEDRGSALDLGWLPNFIPPNICLIISALPGRSLESHKTRDWQTLTIQPFRAEERRHFIVEYLAQYRKSLSETNVNQIASSEQTSNPLYLRTLLEELRVFGIHEELDQKIINYLKTDTVEALFNMVLERLEADYEKETETKGMVRNAMSMLWASRRGLSEAELLEMLGANGGLLPQAYWSPLYLALEESLISRAGLIYFFHDFLRLAVEKRYLTTTQQKQATHKRIADYFALKDLDFRKADELPWQLGRAEEWERLKNCITDLYIFMLLITETKKYELMKYWLLLGDRHDFVESYKHMIAQHEQSNPEEEELADKLHEVAFFFKINDRYTEAEALLLRSLEIKEKLLDKNHPSVAISLNNLGNIYKYLDRYAEASTLLKRALEINEKRYGKFHPYVTRSLNSLAEIYHFMGDLSEAELLFKRAMEAIEKAPAANRSENAIIFNNLASLYLKLGRASEAELLFKRALEAREGILGKTHPDVANSLNNLAVLYHKQARFTEAEALFRSAHEIFIKNFGRDHSDVATSLNNLAALYSSQDRTSEAEPLIEQALEIKEKVFGNYSSEVALSLRNLAFLKNKLNKSSEVESLLNRVLEIQEKLYSNDHPILVQSLNELAAYYYCQGSVAEATAYERKALEICKKTGSLIPEMPPVKVLAVLWQLEQDFNKMENIIDEFHKKHPDLIGDLIKWLKVYKT